MISDDHSRVVLNGEANVSGSDYINASTIVSTILRNIASTSVSTGVGISKGWSFYQLVKWKEVCHKHTLLAYIYD